MLNRLMTEQTLQNTSVDLEDIAIKIIQIKRDQWPWPVQHVKIYSDF